MKFSMAQHREMLANHKSTLEREEVQLSRMVAAVERTRRDVEIYQIRFDAAVAKKMDGFSDRFMKDLK